VNLVLTDSQRFESYSEATAIPFFTMSVREIYRVLVCIGRPALLVSVEGVNEVVLEQGVSE
jgi:hypothetical protein